MSRGRGRRPSVAAREREDDENVEYVFGVHPVFELLRHRSRRVDRILLAREVRGGLGGLLRLAREAGVPVSRVPRTVLARKTGKPNVHQGIAARVAPIPYADPDEICSGAVERSEPILLLDGVEDPRNLGAILRTAAAAGVSGVLLSGEGTVGLTPTVAKTSAGALEILGVGREAKPSKRLESLRGRGLRAVGLDPRGEAGWDEADLTGGIIFVAGGEGRGLRPGLARACDLRVSIPLGRGVESLNVSVALGVLLFERVRQRRATTDDLETC